MAILVAAGFITYCSIADVKAAVKNKVPLVRSLTLSWVTCCIETSSKAVVLKLHKDYVPICMEVSEFELEAWFVSTRHSNIGVPQP